MHILPRRRSGRWSLLSALPLLGLGAVAAGPAAAQSYPQPITGQYVWQPFTQKHLKYPTPTYTQKILCDQFTPSGQDTLYPYNVPTVNYEFGWRNQTSGGVTVTPNTVSTGDMSNAGAAFYVTNLDPSGDKTLRISLQCQSPDPGLGASVGIPTVSAIGATSATVDASFLANDNPLAPQPYTYGVQYGTGYADYTEDSPTTQVTWDNSSTPRAEAIAIPDLEPSTTYHYRVVLGVTDAGDYKLASYSGADQTFTTGPAQSGAPDEAPTVTYTPAVAKRATAAARGRALYVTAPAHARRPVRLRPAGPFVRQRWIESHTDGGRVIRSAHTGRCLDVRAHSGRRGATLVTARCRSNDPHQHWRRSTRGAGWTLVNVATGRYMRAGSSSAPLSQGRRDRHARWVSER